MTRVSVLMPMRNAEAYVGDALRSILEQDYRDLEVIVVDDGSSDASRARVLALGDERVRVVRGPEAGIAEAMNTALAECSGDIVMRCDADDLFASGRLKRQVEFLNQHPEFGAVSGAFVAIDSRGREIGELASEHQSEEITSELLSGETRSHLCTYAIRREAIEASGGFRAFFVTAEDIDFQLRLAEVCRIFFDHRLEYHYRWHDDSVTHSQASPQRLYYEKLAQDCRRQRAQSGTDCVERQDAPPAPQGTDAAQSSSTQIQGLLLAQAWESHRRGLRREALHLGMRALLRDPKQAAVWKSALALLVKRAPSSPGADSV